MGDAAEVPDDPVDVDVDVEVDDDVGEGKAFRRSLSRYPPIMLMIVSSTVAITTGKKIWRRCWE